jgi:hypothetical protein
MRFVSIHELIHTDRHINGLVVGMVDEMISLRALESMEGKRNDDNSRDNIIESDSHILYTSISGICK